LLFPVAFWTEIEIKSVRGTGETVSMGMSCQIRALTEGQIDVLFDHPNRVWDFAYNEDNAFASDDEDEDEDEDDDDDDDDREPLATLLSEPLPEDLWVDKSWAILQFLLRKAAGRPPANINDLGDPSSELLWGETVGDEPADYYGPLLRSIEETQQFAAFLQPLTSDQLLSHFDWQEMRKSKVYLVWEDDADEKRIRGLREYAVENFVALREYVLKAASLRCGLLLWVN
jgi:hypothetical protein